MSTPRLYMYDLETGEYTGSREATLRPNGQAILDATGATPVAPPTGLPEGRIPRWIGGAWEDIEDHRQHMDTRGRKQGGTAYYLPGDTWRSEPHYMTELGPLPVGASVVRPDRPLSEEKEDKRREVQSAYSAALTATLTMPAASPSAGEIAASAALFAVEDAVGLADVQAILARHKESLLAEIEGAGSSEALKKINISFPV